MLGYSTVDEAEEDDDDSIEAEQRIDETLTRTAQIGALPTSVENEPFQQSSSDDSTPLSSPRKQLIDPSLFDDMEEESDLPEEDLIELVAQKMLEKEEQKRRMEMETAVERSQRTEQPKLSKTTYSTDDDGELPQLTTGVGGSWKKNETLEVEYYKPKVGSWGAFARPKDISKAYGGGRRVGPGYSNEELSEASVEATRERLQQYREKVGIDVKSEKDHAAEIDLALRKGAYAMQRGMYSAAVTDLEQVTKYCSSNSKVGGKVFLELAMAYEASGRLEEASFVYRTLSKSRIEEIKINASRLLYGLEAMLFMRDNVGSKAFSRTKVRNTFIDTTGLANIAQNFDDVYNTAWIDLDKGFYKQLTESVVRSPREARQVLMRAVAGGEVPRLRVVQALRSIARRFDDALEIEIKKAESKVVEEESVAVIDGKPILSKKKQEEEMLAGMMQDLDEFILAAPDQMKENLSGEWRLQLLADKKGDGVKFFNSTMSTQTIDMERLSFTSDGGNSGLMNVKQSGQVQFNDERRILSKTDVQVSGGMLGLFGVTNSGAAGAVSSPQQVLSVDSTLLVTRRVFSKNQTPGEDAKEFFAVWRRLPSASGLVSNVDDLFANEMTS
ncbi:hypothetical protein FisN_20Lh148 [Fistulifera solaris]|uniref:Uncharacterized protein n=1 Tax=Fistulifera solaris TaxID=1519565 RepID=A0A1Z5KS82_FISSO|nr:hypothetical protein FisN_20Lh148 [Fistulifera solaris]|eukprot:GAX28851.1 hypothetical protein FisN_20Lh148 [Fistulifera solaris]